MDNPETVLACEDVVSDWISSIEGLLAEEEEWFEAILFFVFNQNWKVWLASSFC